jgi:nucleotide-binding universal stress UspA family protein
MIRRILAAYDGSEAAERAFAQAVELARLSGAELLVVAVARPPGVPADVEAEAAIQHSEEHLRKRFDRLESDAAAVGVRPRLDLLVGRPAEHIVDAAERSGADLIVVGHRSRRLIERLMLGSVAQRVVDRAGCPVLVVK